MAVDTALVRNRLDALDGYLRLLKGKALLERSQFLRDPDQYGSGERFLHLAIEAVFDIGNHCLAGLGLRPPDHYGDIPPALAQAGVIRRETAGNLSSLAGFRNVLVHDYLNLDHERVHVFLNSRLDSIRSFAEDIEEFLRRIQTP